MRRLCRYDTNADGKIDRQELGRMLKELDKDKLQVSETLIERYVESEFAKVDSDASGGISYDEFVEYAARNYWRNSGAILAQLLARNSLTSSIAAAGTCVR